MTIELATSRADEHERKEAAMIITKDTKVSAILDEYGDIADVMELFGDGLTRAGKYSVRRQIAKTITVERAASMHKVPLPEFLDILHRAVETKSRTDTR